MDLKVFQFNSFHVNAFVLFDKETKDCILIDPSCSNATEEQKLVDFIEKNELKPIAIYCTHGHIDHILGNEFFKTKYGIKTHAHPQAEMMFSKSKEYSMLFGFEVNKNPIIDVYIEENHTIKLGNDELKVIYVPGHSQGSVAYYNQKENFAIVGDVLFNGSIGRTDLPGGNFDLLMKSIKEKLFPLGDDCLVFPGHGPSTTIGDERLNNPYL